MKNKRPGIPKANYDKMKGKPGSLKDMKMLDIVIIQDIWYIELAKDSIKYLEKNKRLTKIIKFKNETEINYATNQLLGWLKLSPAWVQGIVETIKKDKDAWFKEVKKFSDFLSPEKSVITTKNIKQEFLDVKGKNPFVKNLEGKVK